MNTVNTYKPVSKVVLLTRCAARCGRERHPDDIYCAECRERATAEAWLVKRREAAR